MTPIMWKVDMVPAYWQWIFKLNPMYYVVNGYRDALYQRNWFFEHPEKTIYFWGITVIMYIVGTNIFGKLKVHFADVL